MRFLITVFWSFAVSLVLAYLLTSMGGDSFQFGPVIAMTITFSIIILFVGEGYIKKEQ